tara:strand:- start:1854 stop:2501 length:648 start_codon:yes stop_codon:yes gene_type:complete
MTENLQVEYDITKKSKFKKFYESNKVLIYSFISVIVILFIIFNLYLDYNEKKKISLSENYVEAKIYLENGDKEKAIKILKSIISANDSTYSSLSLFLLINQNLIKESKELSDLFTQLLNNNTFTDEIRNLMIYKKALLTSDFSNESGLLESLKPLLSNKETVWKAHALILLGDYFTSKGENIKAIEFYQEIFNIKNLHSDIYNHARNQLTIISNE